MILGRLGALSAKFYSDLRNSQQLKLKILLRTYNLKQKLKKSPTTMRQSLFISASLIAMMQGVQATLLTNQDFAQYDATEFAQDSTAAGSAAGGNKSKGVSAADIGTEGLVKKMAKQWDGTNLKAKAVTAPTIKKTVAKTPKNKIALVEETPTLKKGTGVKAEPAAASDMELAPLALKEEGQVAAMTRKLKAKQAKDTATITS